MVNRIGIGPFEKRVHAVFKGRASGARVVLVVIYPEAVPYIPPYIDLKLPDSELGSLDIDLLVGLHVLPGRGKKRLDVIRIMSAFHLYVINSQWFF
jgi:hypothetical protein